MNKYAEYEQNYVSILKTQESISVRILAKSFIYMCVALAISAFAAFTATDAIIDLLLKKQFSTLAICVVWITIVMLANIALKNNMVLIGGILFFIYSFLTGAMLGIVLLMYTESSVLGVFIATSVTFLTCGIFGLLTKRDLTSLGSLLVMGLIGLIIAGIINIFILQSTTFELITSGIGVIMFVGLTAYDAQKIKERASMADEYSEDSLALLGALNLYIDFINLFSDLLHLFGKRK